MAKKAKKAAAKKAVKKAAKKAAPKRAATKGRWTAPGAKQRAAEARRATRAPQQPPLIKGLRIRSLDGVCAKIGDTRAAIARLQGEEKDLERHAHRLMKDNKQTTWQAAGVTLVRVPGEEKLRVTTSRAGQSTAPADEEPEGESENSSPAGTGDTAGPSATEGDLGADDQGIHGAND